MRSVPDGTSTTPLAGLEFGTQFALAMGAFFLVLAILVATYLGLFVTQLVKAAAALPRGQRVPAAVLPVGVIAAAFLIQTGVMARLAVIGAGLGLGVLVIATRSRSWSVTLAVPPVVIALHLVGIYA